MLTLIKPVNCEKCDRTIKDLPKEYKTNEVGVWYQCPGRDCGTTKLALHSKVETILTHENFMRVVYDGFDTRETWIAHRDLSNNYESNKLCSSATDAEHLAVIYSLVCDVFIFDNTIDTDLINWQQIYDRLEARPIRRIG